jgi:hypothetical protein
VCVRTLRDWASWTACPTRRMDMRGLPPHERIWLRSEAQVRHSRASGGDQGQDNKHPLVWGSSARDHKTAVTTTAP